MLAPVCKEICTMTVRKLLLLVAVLAALAAPLVITGSAFAESGCHRSGGGGATSSSGPRG